MIRTYDFKMIRGETKELELTVVDEKGQPVDLTGSTCYLRWRPDIKAAPCVSLASNGGSPAITIQNQTTAKGKYRAKHLPAVTHDLQPGDYKWDSWVVLASGDTFAVIAPSTVSLIQEVTTL